jgi:hypothetical protein
MYRDMVRNITYRPKENYLLLARSVVLHIFNNLLVMSIDFTGRLLSLTEENMTGRHSHSTEYLRRQGCQTKEVI